MAESVGFEPTVPLRAHTISSRAQSSTLATLRDESNGRMRSCSPFAAVFRASGGESGIRTHDGVAPIPVFETGAFVRSAISPGRLRSDYSIETYLGASAMRARVLPSGSVKKDIQRS